MDIRDSISGQGNLISRQFRIRRQEIRTAFNNQLSKCIQNEVCRRIRTGSGATVATEMNSDGSVTVSVRGTQEQVDRAWILCERELKEPTIRTIAVTDNEKRLLLGVKPAIETQTATEIKPGKSSGLIQVTGGPTDTWNVGRMIPEACQEFSRVVSEMSSQADNSFLKMLPGGPDKLALEFSRFSLGTTLTEDQLKEAYQSMVDFITSKENYNEDPAWFVGMKDLTERETKCGEMLRLSQKRLRNYHSGARERLLKELKPSSLNKVEFNRIFKILAGNMKIDQFFIGGGFVRTAEPANVRWCSKEGLIHCPGPNTRTSCRINSSINPYRNASDRDLLSSWEQDHQVTQKEIRDRLNDLFKSYFRAKSDRPTILKDIEKYHRFLYSKDNFQYVTTLEKGQVSLR